ncbi:MAG: Lpg1974 family pore-forming outer membrane protein [Pirellulales bacterium]
MNGFEFDAVPRLVLGYMTCEGLGFRVRLWNYNNAESVALTPAAPGAPTAAAHSLEMTVFDVEAVKAIANPVWAAALSGGYRVSYYKEQASLTGGGSPSVKSTFVGNGFTGAVDLHRRITEHFSLMTAPRASLLMGDGDVVAGAVPQSPLNSGFDVRYVLEAQLGVSYERPIGNGVGFVRGGYEVQYWDDFVAAVGAQSDLSWTLFHGPFFAVGLQR